MLIKIINNSIIKQILMQTNRKKTNSHKSLILASTTAIARPIITLPIHHADESTRGIEHSSLLLPHRHRRLRAVYARHNAPAW